MQEAPNVAVWPDDQNFPDAGSKLAQQPYNWLLPAAFWLPQWNFSSRITHLPFYFWLTDATRPRLIVDLVPGRPDDYLAFCKAIKQLNYGAECYGVADIFDKRELENEGNSPGAYHDAHFDNVSHLHDEPAGIFDALGARTIDLFCIDGMHTSKGSGIVPQQWLARLSPKALVIIVHPEHLASSWWKVLKKRPSFSLNGKPNVMLIAATGAYPPQLSPAFRDPDDPVTATMRSTFEYFGSSLRERALHRDTALFASRVEISLAHQAAATDLLRADKTELEEKIRLRAQDQLRDEARIAVLEKYVEQFRAEVLRLQEYAIKTQTDRDLEIERLQRVITDRDAEVRRLGSLSQRLRSENLRRINVLDGKIQQGEEEILRLSTLASEAESEIARLNQLGKEAASRVNELQSRVIDLESTINHITQSTAWKITRPFRRLFARFPGSARFLRRAVKLVWWTVSLQLIARLRQIRHSRQRRSRPAAGSAGSASDKPSTLPDAGPRSQGEGRGEKPNLKAVATGTAPDRNSQETVRAPDAFPGASHSNGVLRTAGDAVSPPPSPVSIEAVFARIHDFEDRISQLASTVSLLGAPASDVVDRNPAVQQLGIGLERESARIQHVENNVVRLASIVDLERHRTDYALLGVDGMLKEIELYHEARAGADYNRVFRQPSPLVSVCVSTMNRSDMLVERCLRSLVGQSYRNIQIVVVGDHCTDDTGSRIAGLRDDRISFHNLPSRGPYPAPGADRWMVAGTNAINAAMSLCEGQFITHLDDDDVATPDRIETLVNAAQQHEADFCWHPFWCENRDGSWYRLGDGRFELGQITTGSIFYHHYFRKFPWDVFAYRTREPGDWNRLRKIRLLRPTLHFVDRPLMFHYSEGNQQPFARRSGESFIQ